MLSSNSPSRRSRRTMKPSINSSAMIQSWSLTHSSPTSTHLNSRPRSLHRAPMRPLSRRPSTSTISLIRPTRPRPSTSSSPILLTSQSLTISRTLAWQTVKILLRRSANRPSVNSTAIRIHSVAVLTTNTSRARITPLMQPARCPRITTRSLM